MPKTQTERWVFTDRELKKLKSGETAKENYPHANDEFVAGVTSTFGRHRRNEANIAPNIFEILVKRNGAVTNRFADGTAGVPDELKELADDCETLSYIGRGHGPADIWLEVICDEHGNFIRFAE
jgi:hypothetical protein